MHLTRLILNPENRFVQRDLGDCHELHRTIMRAFPKTPQGVNPRGKYSVLHRVDRHPATRLPALIVQSHIEPDWAHLDEFDEYVHPAVEDNRLQKPIDKAYANLKPGMVLLFKLRANPTRKVKAEALNGATRPNGRREPIRGEREQLDWLLRKGDQHGFELLSVSLNRDVYDVRVQAEQALSRKVEKGVKNSHRMTFHSVVYEGRLRIAEPARFQEALKSGIGPAKAFGFGLLSIKRA